jgi:hypothetical protein
MMHAPAADEHLDDGVIVRLLDGEPGDRAAADAHLAACPVCAERLATLRRRSLNLGALLAGGDFAVPAAPRAPAAPVDELAARRAARGAPSRVWLRAAAVAALVVGAGLFSSPLRAWIRDLLGGLGGAAPVAVQPAPAPSPDPAPATEARPASARIQFTPGGDELTVEIARAQAGGALVLSAAPGATASAEVRGPAGTTPAALLVLPAALRIANEPVSVAEYHVAVPASVQRVRVRIGGGAPVIVPAEELANGRRIGLR